MLTIIILTYNEELHIARAISAVSGIAKDIFVVDSFSTDRTVEIAKAHNAQVLQNRFVNYSKQFAWALDNTPIITDWIMRLDADEVVEPDLAVEIAAVLSTVAPDVVGLNLMRKHIFMGRWIRHGGRYPLTLLRIWRSGHGRIEDRWMDEHMVVWGGRTVLLNGGFSDHNLNDLTYFTEKHNKYATREALDVLIRSHKIFQSDTALLRGEGSKQASSKRFAKEYLYNALPIWIGPLGYFLYRYIFQLGFLDGRPGLIYHVLQGFWYRFLVAAKVQELGEAIQDISDTDSKRRELARLTGFELNDEG